MASVCIVGAGELGGAIAHALARRERVGRVRLVDAAAAVAAGKALDIQQSGAVERFHTRLEGTDDISCAAGCDVCVIADRVGRPSMEWQGDDGLAMLTRLRSFAGGVPLVFAGTEQGWLLGAAARELHVPREQLIGSAAEALASAIRSIVAMEAGSSVAEVALVVIGAPPTGFVVPWGEASIGGYALERVLTPVQLRRVEARAARLWPPGPQALGLAAARVVEAIVSSSRRTFNVLTVLSGEFGVRGVTGIVPALLSPGGIVRTMAPNVNPREHVRMAVALGGARFD
jgi:malate/lactate dehydrogenase